MTTPEGRSFENFLITLSILLRELRSGINHESKDLFEVGIQMLFLQGTRDNLADLSLLQPLCERLGDKATVELFAEADHSFHVRARTGKKGCGSAH
jgi:hypothetical protein